MSHQTATTMGYMGFGMRKEDYTRKPKHAFEKRKMLDDIYPLRRRKPNLSKEDKMQYRKALADRFKSSIYQRIIRILLTAVFVLVLYAIAKFI